MTVTTSRGLTEQQLAILDHTLRYELTEPQVLRQRVEPGATRMTITKRMGRLRRRKLVVRYPLEGSRSYYRLGPAASYLFGLPDRLIGPIGPQRFELARAVLHYCCLGPRPLERLKPSELASAYPTLPDSELLQPFYIDPGGYLGQFRLADPKTPTSRIVASLRALLESRLALGEPFASLLPQGKFLVVLMTYTDSQRASLTSALKSSDLNQLRDGWPAVPIRVHTIPG